MTPAMALARLVAVAVMLVLCRGADDLEASWDSDGAPLGLRQGRLRLGIDASYPPFAVARADGQLEGLEVDLANEIARRLDVRPLLENTDVGGGLDALAADRYDGLLAGLSPSPDLTDRALFSRPYFDDGPRLLARGSAPPAGITGQRVGVELGSPTDELARQHRRRGVRFELIQFADPTDLVAGLRAGEVDLAMMDATTARQALAGNPSFRVADEPLERRPLALALRRPNRGLVFAVDRALASMEADGTLVQLARRWLGA